MDSMASRYFGLPVLSEAAMKPEYNAANVQSRLKSCLTRSNCQSATLSTAFSTAARFNAGDKSVARGRATSGASPTALKNSDGVFSCAKHATQKTSAPVPASKSTIRRTRISLFLEGTRHLVANNYVDFLGIVSLLPITFESCNLLQPKLRKNSSILKRMGPQPFDHPIRAFVGGKYRIEHMLDFSSLNNQGQSLKQPRSGHSECRQAQGIAQSECGIAQNFEW